MIEFEGNTYRIVDSHTHWSNLLSRITKPFFTNGFVMPEIIEILEKSLSNIKKQTNNRRERNMVLFLQTLDWYGIDKAILLPIFNIDISFSTQLQAKFPEKVIGFGFLNPIDKKIDTLYDSMHKTKNKLKGFKLHAEFSKFNPTIHRNQFEKCFNFLQEEKLIALFHTGSHFNINELYPILKQFPAVKVILGHSGLAPQIEQAIECAHCFSNVYLELSGQPYSYLIKKAIKDPNIGIERILYGSDLPSLHPTVEQMKVLSLPISESEKQMIFAENIERLIK